MPRAWFVTPLVLLVFSPCGSLRVAQGQMTSYEGSRHYERVVLTALLPVFRSAKKTGRIYYEATCPPGEADYPLTFPRVELRAAGTRNPDVVGVVRSLLSTEHIRVAEEAGDVIRARFGNPPDAILQTQIPVVHLSAYEQFNPLLAIYAVINSPQVRAAMDKAQTTVPQRVASMAVVQPAEGLPRLASEISNVTMDQAFDMIARTWSGVVLYGACTRTGMYEVSFADSTHVVGSR